MLTLDFVYNSLSNYKDNFNKDNDIFMFTLPESITISLDNFIYMNRDDNRENVLKENIKDALWRLISKDDISKLSNDSFLRKYACTKESKEKLIDKIAALQNISKDSDKYKELVNTFNTSEDEFIYPLYNYPRNTLVKSKLTAIKTMSGLPADAMSLAINDAENNDDYKKLSDDKEKVSFIEKNYIHPYKSTILDQYHEVLFYIKQNLTLATPYMNVIRCIDPSTVHFPINTDKALIPTYNLINGNNPFPLLLETMQFIHVNDKLSLVLNFNSFNIGNLFDVLFSMVLLLIASHESKIDIDKIIINSPYYFIAKNDYEYFSNLNADSLPRYKLSFNPSSQYVDFTTADAYMFKVEEV